MWRIPRNLDVSACVRDTLESNWDSEELSQICEQSLMWRGKPSLARTWLQRLKRVNWMQHLSGRILKPSMESLFETEYTLSLADFPVSLSLLPEKDRERQTPDTFGRILNESFNQLDLFGASLKTSVDTLQLDSPKFIEAYEIWVTKLRQDCLRRQSAVHRIDGNGCLSWQTPNTLDYAAERGPDALARQSATQRKERTSPANLREQVNPANWPTVTAQDAKNNTGPSQYNRNSYPLNVAAQDGLLVQDSPNTNGKSRELWSTPESRNQKGYHNQKDGTVIEKLGTQAGKGKLNPDWVEQLMGLQVGWTDLGCWVTELSPDVQKKRLES